jgi:hypothetical protein
MKQILRDLSVGLLIMLACVAVVLAAGFVVIHIIAWALVKTPDTSISTIVGAGLILAAIATVSWWFGAMWRITR